MKELARTEARADSTYLTRNPLTVAFAQGKEVVRVDFIAPQGRHRFTVEAFEGQSLRDIVVHGEGMQEQLLGEYIECACDGVMACSTCHVYIDPDWMERVGQPCDAEEDMLELAFEREDNSRLGCRVVLTPELDGVVISIPDGAHNYMDDIPFKDRSM